jgi:hypothetical protein
LEWTTGEDLTSCREYFSEAFRKDLVRGFRGQKALDWNGLTLTLPMNLFLQALVAQMFLKSDIWFTA